MLGNNPYRKGIDWMTVFIYTLLVGFGWMNLYAANFNPETGVFFSVNAEYFKQLVWIGISIVSVCVIMILDAKLYVEISYIVYFVSIALLMLTVVAGHEVNGAKAWLVIGPIQFQPVEFTKLGTALVVSRMMSRYNFTFNTSSFMRIGGILLLPIVLVLLQNDTGSALIFFTFLLPMFREGMSPHILLLGLLAAVAAIASLLIGDEWVMAFALLVSVITIIVVFQRNGQRDFGIYAVLAGIGAAVGILSSTISKVWATASFALTSTPRLRVTAGRFASLQVPKTSRATFQSWSGRICFITRNFLSAYQGVLYRISANLRRRSRTRSAPCRYKRPGTRCRRSRYR